MLPFIQIEKTLFLFPALLSLQVIVGGSTYSPLSQNHEWDSRWTNPCGVPPTPHLLTTYDSTPKGVVNQLIVSCGGNGQTWPRPFFLVPLGSKEYIYLFGAWSNGPTLEVRPVI